MKVPDVLLVSQNVQAYGHQTQYQYYQEHVENGVLRCPEQVQRVLKVVEFHPIAICYDFILSKWG